MSTNTNYKRQIDDVKSILDALLSQNEFINSYYQSKNNPTNDTYKNQLQNIIANVNTNIRTMFNVSTQLYNSTQSFNQQIATLRERLEDAKTTNRELKTQAGLINTKHGTSQELIHDYIDIYDVRYVRNWAIGLGAVLILTTIPKV